MSCSSVLHFSGGQHLTEKQTNNVVCVQNERTRTVTRSIGGTVYRLTIGFSQDAKETMEDKLIRIIRNEAWKQPIEAQLQTRHPA